MENSKPIPHQPISSDVLNHPQTIRPTPLCVDRRHPRRHATSQHYYSRSCRTSHFHPKHNAQTPHLLIASSTGPGPPPQSIFRRRLLRRCRPSLRRSRNRHRPPNASDPVFRRGSPISNARHLAGAPGPTASPASDHRDNRSSLIIRGPARRSNESGERQQRHVIDQPKRGQPELETGNGSRRWPKERTGQSRRARAERTETPAAATGYAVELEPRFRTAGRQWAPWEDPGWHQRPAGPGFLRKDTPRSSFGIHRSLVALGDNHDVFFFVLRRGRGCCAGHRCMYLYCRGFRVRLWRAFFGQGHFYRCA